MTEARKFRPLPSTDPIQLDEELFYEDLRAHNPEIPPWQDLSIAQRDVVLGQLWNVWRAGQVAGAMVLRAAKPTTDADPS